MFIWGVDGLGMSAVELNSGLTVFDAVVDARIGAASGAVYPSIVSALADGKQSILVRDGTYAGFTVNNSGVHIQAVRKPMVSSGDITAGVKITGLITVNEPGCTLLGLGVSAGTGGGIILNNSVDQVVDLCAVLSTGVNTATGINIKGDVERSLVQRCRIGNMGNGILVGPTISQQTRGLRLVGNFIEDCSGYGIGVFDYDGSDLVHYRNTEVEGNYILRAADEWGSGILVEAATGARVIGNFVQSCGSPSDNPSGHGIYVQAPPAIPNVRSIVEANHSMFNNGYGLVMSALTSRVAVTGNVSTGNYAGNFANCGSCPGYNLAGSYGTNVGS